MPKSHTEIDKNPGDWSAKELRNLKTEHERWVKDNVSTDRITGTEGQFHGVKIFTPPAAKPKLPRPLKLIVFHPRRLKNINMQNSGYSHDRHMQEVLEMGK